MEKIEPALSFAQILNVIRALLSGIEEVNHSRVDKILGLPAGTTSKYNKVYFDRKMDDLNIFSPAALETAIALIYFVSRLSKDRYNLEDIKDELNDNSGGGCLVRNSDLFLKLADEHGVNLPQNSDLVQSQEAIEQ